MVQPATTTPHSADATLDRVLELFARAELSATEMRVLLALLKRRDATIVELAEVLDTHPAEITRAGRRLAMRGLIRWHHGGRPEHALLDGTVTGAATIKPLLASMGSDNSVPTPSASAGLEAVRGELARLRRCAMRGEGRAQMGIYAHGPGGQAR
jgi:N-acetylglucosamine-6-phosphate deacetylase